MRYVGIDPSSKTGLAIIDDEGNIHNVSELECDEESELERFIDIAQQITDELQVNDVIAIEGFSYGSKGKGVSFQYGLGWIIRYYLWERGFKIVEVAPTAVKKFATGTGNIKKENMVLPIYKKWGFEHSSDNVRDAYVLAQIAKALHDKEGLTAYQLDVMKKVK